MLYDKLEHILWRCIPLWHLLYYKSTANATNYGSNRVEQASNLDADPVPCASSYLIQICNT